MRDRNAPLTPADGDDLAWDRMGGLIPAAVQDARSGQLLMLGYMSRAALAATLETGFVTFFSRSRRTLWKKGETSGNVLKLVAALADCDGDALLIRAEPEGPTCHLGTPSCFGGEGAQGVGFLAELARIVGARSDADPEESYTARLLGRGPVKIAQKVGEEGVEVALAGAAQDRDACIAETADLLYHLAVLMEARDYSWDDVMTELRRRHR